MADASGRVPGDVAGEESADRWLLPVLGRLVVVAGIVVSALDIVVLRHGRNTPTPFGMFGIVMLLAGLSLYVAARLTLGKFYSETVKTKPEHSLITSGPYRIIRHPIYLGVILYAFSIPIILGSLYGFLVMLPLMPMLYIRVRFEEKVMASEFGEEYAEYARRTKRFIPYLY